MASGPVAGFVEGVLGGTPKQFLGGIAGGFFGNDYLRDFKHASKTFRSNLYQNAPKLKFLFQVYFDINAQAYSTDPSIKANFGILVKSVKLPSFSFTTAEMNQYNRKRIVQTKIKYDPVDIKFHDDNRNLIAGLWYKYYTYYYKDGVKSSVIFAGNRGSTQATPGNPNIGLPATTAADYNARTIYENDIGGNNDWGYIGESDKPSGSPNPTKIPFFKNITIFGFNQHQFIAYTLINPIITRFNHDTYDYAGTGETMENTMTVDYETVAYNQGNIDGNNPDNIVQGFGDVANYDRVLSPISTPGSNSNILGPNGLIESAGGAMKSFQDGNILQAIRTAGATYNQVKNTSAGSISAGINQAIQNALQGTLNPTRQRSFDIPMYGASPGTQGTAGVPTGPTNPTQLTTVAYAGQQLGSVVTNLKTSVTSSISNLFSG